MAGLKRFYFEVIGGERNGLGAGLFKCVLWVLSGFYLCASLLHKKAGLRRRIDLGTPVISVGNITWGGTGKTPLVDLIVQRWRTQGKTCAVLMRGYGADEDALLRAKHPGVHVLSGAARAQNARDFLRHATTDLFILDDGFQHWPLDRQCDIVTINCVDPFPGGGALIPRGALREPLAALGRADLVVLTHSDLVSSEEKRAVRLRVAEYVPVEKICEARVVPSTLFRASQPDVTIDVQTCCERRVLLFAGVGTPESFRRTIAQCGMHICDFVRFPDHHFFDQRDWDTIRTRASEHKADMIITTEKDYMRSKDTRDETIDFYVVAIKMEITDNHDAFIRRLDRLLVD